MKKTIPIRVFVFAICVFSHCLGESSSNEMKIPQALEAKLDSIKPSPDLLHGNVTGFLVAFDKILREKAGTRLRIEYGADVAKSMAQILSEPIRDVLGITQDELASNPFATHGEREKKMDASDVIYWLEVRLSPCKTTYANGVITISIRDE